jgi:dienelactone hydrolase
MPLIGRRLPTLLIALWTAVLAPLPWHRGTFAAEPYRLLSPTGAAPRPAVLLVSGCAGFVASDGNNIYDERASELQAAGYFVLFVDYVGRRYLRDCGHVSHAEVGQDILEATAWIRRQAGVDPDRISVVGWSYGGGGVLAALRAMPPESPAFAKAVMYYPDCRAAKPWSAQGVTALMLLGAIDDVTLPAVCDSVTNRVSPQRVRSILYPNARHGFDVRGLPERAEYPFGTIGYNAEAAKASWAAALGFLNQ